MTIDEVVKLILAISFAISLLGVSWQLMRLIGKMADSIEDVRGGLKSASKLVETASDDYNRIRTEVWSLLDSLKKIRDVFEPLSKIFTVVSGLGGFLNPKRDKLSTSETDTPASELE
jgi:hypothetical protein